jgi:hypothetical protein
MPKNKKNKPFIYVLLLCLLYVGGQQRVWGQQEPLPNYMRTDEDGKRLAPYPTLEEQIDMATFVFEGLVTTRDIIQAQDGKYYTRNLVAVYKIFKGNFVADTIELIGRVGFNTAEDADSLSRVRMLPDIESVTFFFLIPSDKNSKDQPTIKLKFQLCDSGFAGIYNFFTNERLMALVKQRKAGKKIDPNYWSKAHDEDLQKIYKQIEAKTVQSKNKQKQ